ncbi:MAG: hypothetical protein QXH24_04050 [Candidatus Bathyarchaeia archaeon]
MTVIIYAGGFLIFDPLNLIACIISPLGAYTIIYALKTQRDYLYYLSLGLIVFIIGLSFALYRLVNVIVLFGLLLVLLAVLVLFEYWRRGDDRREENRKFGEGS